MNIRIEVKKAVPGSKRTEYLKTYATKTEFFTTPDDFPMIWEKLCIV